MTVWEKPTRERWKEVFVNCKIYFREYGDSTEIYSRDGMRSGWGRHYSRLSSEIVGDRQ